MLRSLGSPRRPPRRPLRRPSTLAALVITAVAVGMPLPFSRAAAHAASATPPRRRQPNILFVLADDLDVSEMHYLPHVRELVGDAGTTFDDYFVSNSLCCPSRTTTLRGQYAHNTGVWTNGGDNGGFEHAHALGIEQDTVATRLHDAGYTTLLAGKYLNGYPAGAPTNDVPPGWDHWASAVSGNPYREFDYVLNQDQQYRVHGHRPRDYGTDVYTGITERFVRSAARRHQPFFAYLAVYAPHQPATPAPRDRKKFAHVRAPRTPSYDQADVRRSPSFVRDLPRFDASETAAIDSLYRQRIRSLQAVDRGVARLVDTLRATHQLDDTYVVFASDNGFHLGQHRMPAGKQTAYDTDIHVPLLVRGPGVRAGAHVTRLAGNTDLAPTLESMGGARIASFSDGRSLLPLLQGSRPARWRQSYLVEHRVQTGETQAARVPDFVKSTLEPPDPDEAGIDHRFRHRQIRDAMLLNHGAPLPDYDAVRTGRWLYAEYAGGDRELYDLHADPDEVDNLAGTRPAVEHALAQRIAELKRCRGRSCWVAENRAVPDADAPASGPGVATPGSDGATGLAATMPSLR